MKVILLFIWILLFATFVTASTIDIEIKTELIGNISALFYNVSNSVLGIKPEFYNSGSVAYKVRARLDVLNSTNVIFTGWSDEKVIMPSERKDFEIYWYSPEALKTLTARVRFYYGMEFSDREVFFDMKSYKSPEDVIQIKNFRTYDDHIRFEIKSSKDLKNVVIIPKNYLPGWIFEQAKIENLEANKNTEVIMKYQPTVWSSHHIDIEAFTMDGNYHSLDGFEMEKESGIMMYVHYLTDRLSTLLNL